MLRKLKCVLKTVLPNVIYGHYEYDNAQNVEPPFIVFQEINKRPPDFADDKPLHYERSIQITLITKKKDEVLEKKLEDTLLEYDYIFSLITETYNSDHSLNRIYEIKLEEFIHAKQ